MNYSYVKKPTVIQAFQMTYLRRQDNRDWPSWLHEAWTKNWEAVGAVYPADFPNSDGTDPLRIRTLEGTMRVSWNDYIVRGIQGELYSVKPDIFEALHDPQS
jgi:hypothetical protein